MSIAVMAMFAGFFVLAGPPTPEPDEGVAAHIFQLLMAGQIPIIAFFAVEWVPRDYRGALRIIALQIAAGILAAAPVFIFKL